MLMNYAWPGNVRELQNVVERALILNPEGPLAFDHVTITEQPTSTNIETIHNDNATLDEIVSSHIKSVLQKTDGRIHGKGGAA